MRIITYKNPFELKEMKDIWDDICKYPHLCVSQTLVEGLKEYYGRESFSLICTIDQMVSHFYDEWHNNSEGELFQFVKLSNAINKQDSSRLKRAFAHNRTEVLNAIRFMIEAGIKRENIDENQLSQEQRFLIKLFDKVKDEECFLGLENKNQRGRDGLEICAIQVMEEELLKYINLTHEEIKKGIRKRNFDDQELKARIKLEIQKENEKAEEKHIAYTNKGKKIEYLLNLFDGICKEEKEIPFDKVIFHGVHQFSPILLKFINKLEELDIEVVFLINYCEEFNGVYETWDEVYKWTHVVMEHRGSLDNIIAREIGENIGLIYEGKLSQCKKTAEPVNKFSNLTAFADYVDPIFKKAKQVAQTSPTNQEGDRLEVIAKMNEQFYAVNGEDLNEILKVYFPEHFGGRHFLSYPVGQFILGLYNMWSETEKLNRHKDQSSTEVDLVVNPKDMKECLALNIWKTRSSVTVLEIYYDLMVYFRKEQTISQYIKLVDKLKRIAKDGKDERLKRFGFFKYTEYDLEQFKKALIAIQDLANKLFADTREVKLKRHFLELMQGISQITADTELSEGEINAIEEIKKQLEDVNLEDIDADVADIKETVHFYLQNNKPEDYKAEWIVRDFEQIDGGVLLAKAQQRSRSVEHSSTCYHFGGLSDKNMLGGKTVPLPWPLTLDMIQGMNGITHIVSVCKKEYPNFLRYAVFYGTYFLTQSKDIVFSYVENENDSKKEALYSPLNLLNLKVENKVESDLFGEQDKPKAKQIPPVDIDRNLNASEKRSATACYRRFLYNHCLDRGTHFNNEFDIFYIAQFYAACGIKTLIDGNMDVKIADKKYRNLFPFMDEMDYYRINKVQDTLDMKKYDEATNKNFIDTKLEFKFFMWEEENKETGQVQSLLKHIAYATKGNEKAYNKLIRNIDEFINANEMSYLPESHNWKVCEVCNQRDVCCRYVEIRENEEWEENY